MKVFLCYKEHAGSWWLALKAVTADTWSDACVGFSLSANCICDNIYWISFPYISLPPLFLLSCLLLDGL